MEVPQRRRRPAATYGKPAKKRCSDVGFGEIFTSTGSPGQIEELPEEKQRTTLVGGATTTAATTRTAKVLKPQEKENQTTNVLSSRNTSGANLLVKETRKKAQTTSKGKNKRPITASAITSPPKHHKVFDFAPSDEEGDGIAQPQMNTWRHKGIDEFDVPSSDEEESITVRKNLPLQRPFRAPNTSTNSNIQKFAKEVKKGVVNPSAKDPKLTWDNPAPKKQEKQTAASKNIAAKKATKSITSSKPRKDPEAPKPTSSSDRVPEAPKPAKKPVKAIKNITTAPPESEQIPSSSRMTSFTVEIKTVSHRSRVTRSKSRQPSLEPEVLVECPPEPPVRRTSKSTQTKSQTTSTNRPTKLISLPVISDESPVPQCPPQFSLSSQTNSRDPVPYSPGIFTHVDEPPTRDTQPKMGLKGAKRIPRLSEIFQNRDELPVPQRRRLIDRLGVRKPGERLMVSTSDSSEDSSEDSEGEYTQQSLPSQQSISQSQNIFESQPEVDIAMEESQQFITEPVAKSVYNNGGPKITYARQRSFRTEELDENALFNVPLVMSQQSFRGQRNGGIEEDEELEGDTGSKMMKTIHELREAGVNNRFLDDIEELFGDIEGDSPLGRRRSGYLELAGKMRDKSFIGKFRANNFTERLFSKLNKQTDEIVCFSLSYILCCLLLEDSTIQTVSQVRSNGSIPMLIRMLDFEKDICVIAKDRKTNMSKAAQSMVQDLRIQVEKSPAFSDKKPKMFSPQIMALKVLEQSVRKLRESGIGDDILLAGGSKKLVQILKPFATPKPKDTTKIPDTFPLELAVSILESHTIGSRILAEQHFSEAELNIVAALLPAVVKVKTGDVNDILLLILRFDINLTNNRASICDIFAESSLIPTLVKMVCTKFNDLAGLNLEMDDRLVKLDLLILSLGLLINFAELSDKARCAVNRRGAPTDEKILLDVLLHIFLERQERAAEADSVEESQSNVAFGYLSILLGNLCQNRDIQDKVRLKMPKVTLQPLFSSLEEFIAHHRKVDDQYESYGDPNAAFTERLEQMVRRLKEG